MIVCKGRCDFISGCYKHAYVISTRRYEFYDKCSRCEIWLEKGRYVLCPCCHGLVKTTSTNKHKSAIMAKRY